jgi:hypothetical protein
MVDLTDTKFYMFLCSCLLGRGAPLIGTKEFRNKYGHSIKHHESSKYCACVDFNASICGKRLAKQENDRKPKTKQTTKELHPSFASIQSMSFLQPREGSSRRRKRAGKLFIGGSSLNNLDRSLRPN